MPYDFLRKKAIPITNIAVFASNYQFKLYFGFLNELIRLDKNLDLNQDS